MKTVALSLLIMLLSTTAFPQEQKSFPSNTLKIGTGAAFLGTGDVWIGKLEMEYSKMLNSFFETGVSLNFGHLNHMRESLLGEDADGGNKEYSYFREIITTYHLDHNIYFYPFKNYRKINLKLGTGYSLMYITEAFGGDIAKHREEANIEYLWYETRSSIGINVIPEFEFNFKKNNILSLKLMTQAYLNADISSSVLLKYGKRF